MESKSRHYEKHLKGLIHKTFASNDIYNKFKNYYYKECFKFEQQPFGLRRPEISYLGLGLNLEVSKWEVISSVILFLSHIRRTCRRISLLSLPC
jgi:hypothetical protein